MKFRFFLALVGLVGALVLDSGVSRAGDERLALKGYDTVGYFTKGQPMMGDPQYRHTWDGSIYQFASAKHLEMFKADPDRWLPQHRNFCTAALSRGEIKTPDPNNWIVHEGRLYLFAGAKGPSRLLADAERVKATANANFDKFSKAPAGLRQ